MKKHVMKKWVKALRSGEYKQGRVKLVDNKDRFCCLGVLCNIAPDSTGEWTKIDHACGREWAFAGACGNLTEGVLPDSIRDWSGIKSDLGEISSLGTALTSLNDNGASFTEIADIIEKHWEEL